MGKLIGLEGVSRDIDCLFVNKGSEIDVILRNDMAATTADYFGSINVYKDNDGVIRCVAMAHFREIEKKKYKSIVSAAKWTDRWIHKIKHGIK